MTWLSVNSNVERAEIIQSAMAISGLYKQGWSECGEYMYEIPDATEVHPIDVADLYNNADKLGLDIYRVNDSPKNEHQI